MSNQTDLEVGNGVLRLYVKCGEVIGQQKWSETEISSSGGGGYIGPQGGNITAPTISSSSKTKQEIWIREDDGLEFPLELTDSSFSAMQGQRVWLAFCGNSNNTNSSRCLLAYNQSSDHYCSLLSDWTSWLYRSCLLKKPLIYRLLTTWLSFIISLISIWVILPLLSNVKGQLSVTDALTSLIDHFHLPASYQIWLKIMSGSSTGDFIIIGVYSLLLWLVLYFILKIIGKLLFLNSWENKQVDSIYNKILSASKELAGDYARTKT